MKDFKENIFSKTENKSVFGYITDAALYKNKNECSNYTPPFISYVPIGVQPKNIDVDTSLRGINQYLSKCTEFKYRQEDNLNIELKKNEKECDTNFNILNSGYMPFDKYQTQNKK